MRPSAGPRLTCCLLPALAALIAAPAGTLPAAGNPASTPGAAEPVNRVANGDFSRVSDSKPDEWQVSGDQNVTQTLGVGRDAAGKPFAQLTCTRCEPKTPASHAMICQVGCVSLVKGRSYEFSCRARAEGLAGRTVSVALSDTKTWTNCGLYEPLPVGAAWKAYKRLFYATRDVGPTSRLQFWFNEPGTFELADVRIVECSLQEAEFTDLVPAAGGRNLVFNGSFELGPAGWSSMGQGTGWGDLACLHGHIEAAGGTHGAAFLRIPLGGEQTPVLYFDYYEPVVRRELRPLAAGVGWIKVEKGAPHTVSCDLRASREDGPVVLGVRAGDPTGRWSDQWTTVKISKAWKRYAFTFRPSHRFVFPVVGPNLGEDQPLEIDIDAVQLEKGERATGFEPRATVEFALEPSQPSGIFVAGQPAAVRLRFSNHAAAPVQATVRFQVTDFEDKPVPWPQQAVDVAARATAERNLPIPADWRGFYRVRATAEAGGRTESADVRIAVVPKRTAADTVCGINHAFPSAYLIRLASMAGVTWYRDWSLKWQHVEPARGQFRWEVGDAQIDRVLREGVSVLPLLPPFPSADWSSEAPDGLPTTGYPGVRLRQAWGPKDPRDLAAFIEKGVARYKDRIHVWEFLNEPVYTDYALPADRTGKYGGRRYGPEDYVALLKTASAAMKKADPACKVIGGIGSGPRQMTREILDAGCLEHLDILNLHLYPGSRVPESYAAEMDDLLAMMQARGGRRPLWVTEFSYYGTDDLPYRPFFPSPHSWSELRFLESERQCADYTLRFFTVMLARGVGKVFIHSGASGTVNRPNFECALFAYGGAPRKLFPAMAVFTELLGPTPSCAGDRRLGESGYAVAFETGGHSVLVLWCADDGAGSSVAGLPSAGLAWRDMMGRAMPSPPALSTSPVYVLGPAGKAKELLAAVRSEGQE